MPESMEETMDYMGMLDKLASEYPELEETAMALSGELDEIMPMDDEMGMEEEDMMMEEEEFAPIPPELMDEEMEEEEFDLEL